MIVRGDERSVADLLDDYEEALDRRDWTRLEQLFLSTATSEWALETPSSNHVLLSSTVERTQTYRSSQSSIRTR